MENSHKDYTTMSLDMQAPFRIDPEFENKIPPIGEDEFKQLRENILEAGEVREPLVVWNGTLVDGHNRWKVVLENPHIKYKVQQMDFPDKWAAFEWMYKNQLGRRNLTDEQREYTIGKMYEARKNSIGNTTSTRNSDGTFQCIQSGYIGSDKSNRVSDQIAGELNIGKGTVLRAQQFAKSVDALRKVNPEAADKVLNGKAKATKADIREIRNADQDDLEVYAEAIVNEMSISPLPTAKKVTKVRIKTPEDMENLQKIEAIVNEMYDPTAITEFTIDFLLEDIEVNGQIYVELLANTLKDRENLVTDENKPRIAAAIDKVVENILKVRESM